MVYKPKKYHRRSIRLQGYDYSQDGMYFITVCTHAHLHIFGKISDGVMLPNALGNMVYTVWLSLSEMYQGIVCGPCVVMPNHIHGIIQIVGAQFIAPKPILAPDATNTTTNRGAMNCAPTVGKIVRAFKAKCSRMAATNFKNTTNCAPKVWQRNYYEHIIRNEDSYRKITEYITNNPLLWQDDVYYAQ